MSLNTTPRTWVTGEVVTAAEMNTEVRDALTGLQAAWTSYTPALTAVTTAPTLGSGSSAAGTWDRRGKTIIGEADIVAGTSGTLVGSGAYQVSLPTATDANAVTLGKDVGHGFVFDSSAGRFYPFILRCDTTTTARLIDCGTGVFITDSLPAGFAGLHTSDRVQYKFEYQAA